MRAIFMPYFLASMLLRQWLKFMATGTKVFAMAQFLESIMRGIQNPVTTPRKAPIRPVDVALPDVPAIRASTGLSQADFAKSIGVKRATLLNWEQKRRVPDGPARVLLALIEKDPGLVQRVLAGR